MDENYLDDLLNDISNKGKSNDDFDNAINSDVGLDIDFSDIDNISLEELDGFDDLCQITVFSVFPVIEEG